MTVNAKALLAAAVALTMLGWVATAPADDPEVPEKYIKVAEAKALLDQKKRVSFIDVRPREHYDQLHIKGALNIPLGDLSRRLAEVPKQVPVVLY
jgi:3-mercaptopyruvate sulfurtransferase SseA